jgi:hypothetical protein
MFSVFVFVVVVVVVFFVVFFKILSTAGSYGAV